MTKQSTFRRLLDYMWRYKWISLLALAFIFATTLVTTALPLLARSYIDQFVSREEATNGLYLLGIYYGLFLLRVLLTFLGQYAFARVAYSIVRDLRQETFANMQQLRMAYFDQTAAGAIVSRLTNDTQSVADMFSSIFSNFLSSMLILVVTIATMLALNWRLTLLIVLFLPIMLGSIILYQRLSNRLLKQVRARLSDLNVKLSESIEGMRIIQAFSQEKRLIEEFEAINGEHLDFSNRYLNVNSLFLRPAMSLLKILAYALILTYFGLSWQVAGVTAGVMYAFIQYVNQLFNPLIDVMQNYSVLQTSMVAAERVFELMDRRDFEPEQAEEGPEIQAGNIDFQHVSFSYEGKREILKDISFSVKQGETIAFVGSTGSGKSSIINLFLRFYEFEKGRILIDGRDIRDYSQAELRRNIGLVLQDPFLYHGTIASNIRMYQDSLSQAEVEEAARFVDAHDFISQLPQGYDNPVTERGSTFSSGQRQLLAFARTIATKPKILILDEATANIDSETEELIQHSLRKMRQGRTTIAIAHRLSTIQDANCIYVLDKGRIIESGSHEELLAQNGTYKKMYQLQAGMMDA
ncbi:putative multidrug resistance ABC transporter ATP-binding/permease protein YheH [Streptococcus cristatus]|uniref:Putative multidrug resistance ABC transporter ATP-binding/permease protein YheH n=1 Tax=Streptococcus cristatus TaxID=45634 RepID=A0A3R9LRU9_STRCR|nr:ABC transporter ATP-binding protein [Streptococcus cristatus]RSJ78977.1 putative multidrug resistance ABC transporter ATP-binding/permease protein YheH [Streptococcus cristatus]RSJ79085.1 putative multidrug resistance ABC transporter ATP-binding/permease protein YheH [Streptococcus cristatus]RSJ84946.1 putative multidrug resistance ABC transporter ATP-binding/permease protein YheH [Streptococcus cristatus]RSJ85452.1 putative multidrug resistance ABC transporter ATP-binding/permease protein Y